MKEFFGIQLDKLFKINSSHFVIYEGFREPLHGHNYKVSIKLKAKKLDSSYMVLDFDHVKPIMTEICDSLKHSLLLPKYNKWLTIMEVDEKTVNVDCLTDGSKFSFPKKDIRIIETEQISAECLAKYIAIRFKTQLEEIHSEILKQIELVKIVCKVTEDKGKQGIYYLENI
jgi:6-pyruvoyl-tetrahydropterin synthase